MFTIRILFTLMAFLFSAAAQAESRFDLLLTLHQKGKLIPLYASANPQTSFLCYGRLQPDLAVSLKLSYQNNLVRDFTSNDELLTAIVDGQLVPVREGTVDTFNGLVMAGTSLPKRLAALDSSAARMTSHPEIFISLSTHESSDRHLLAIFRKKQDDKSVPNLCQIRESVEYVCIEAEWEI